MIGAYAAVMGQPASPPVTVLLVDDHPLIRRGLSALLGLESWVGRVVEAATIHDGAREAVVWGVDVAVVDLGLPDGNGVDLVRRLRRAPGCPVLVLSMNRDDAAVRECLAAGATGYVLKDSPPDAVVRAVRGVLDGDLVLGAKVAAAALPTSRRTALPAPLNRLTPTDLRLLILVAQGRTNAEVADEMGMAEKTVRNRFSGVLRVLGVADRVQAVLLARKHGLHG